MQMMPALLYDNCTFNHTATAAVAHAQNLTNIDSTCARTARTHLRTELGQTEQGANLGDFSSLVKAGNQAKGRDPPSQFRNLSLSDGFVDDRPSRPSGKAEPFVGLKPPGKRHGAGKGPAA